MLNLNQGAECSTQKHSKSKPGSRMLDPKAGNHTTKEQGAQPGRQPANNYAKNAQPLIMLNHKLTVVFKITISVLLKSMLTGDTLHSSTRKR